MLCGYSEGDTLTLEVDFSHEQTMPHAKFKARTKHASGNESKEGSRGLDDRQTLKAFGLDFRLN